VECREGRFSPGYSAMRPMLSRLRGGARGGVYGGACFAEDFREETEVRQFVVTEKSVNWNVAAAPPVSQISTPKQTWFSGAAAGIQPCWTT
jgi:hypothetical protein